MEIKANIIRRLMEIIRYGDSIIADGSVWYEQDKYFDLVKETIGIINANHVITPDIQECINDVNIERKHIFWYSYLISLTSNRYSKLFGPSPQQIDAVIENINHNKQAIIHLYRAIAREEILAGKLPMM